MKISMSYPINGHDVDLFIDGIADGELVEFAKVIVKYKNAELFRYDGVQKGILVNTEIADEIMNICTTILIDEHDEVSANN